MDSARDAEGSLQVLMCKHTGRLQRHEHVDCSRRQSLCTRAVPCRRCAAKGVEVPDQVMICTAFLRVL